MSLTVGNSKRRIIRFFFYLKIRCRIIVNGKNFLASLQSGINRIQYISGLKVSTSCFITSFKRKREHYKHFSQSRKSIRSREIEWNIHEGRGTKETVTTWVYLGLFSISPLVHSTEHFVSTFKNKLFQYIKTFCFYAIERDVLLRETKCSL